jgi:hypothetical protein
VPQLPPVVWIVAGVVALLLFALCLATVRGMLRPATRLSVARWPVSRLVVLVVASSIPWLIVTFAPITIKVSIHGLIQLVGWLGLALLAFALLVLLPLAALLSLGIWSSARRRAR